MVECASLTVTSVTPAAKNPAQTAAYLTSNETSLFPFVNTGTVDVSGGHFDAGDYSKYTIDCAALVHYLMFTVDSIPGAASLDAMATRCRKPPTLSSRSAATGSCCRPCNGS